MILLLGLWCFVTNYILIHNARCRAFRASAQHCCLTGGLIGLCTELKTMQSKITQHRKWMLPRPVSLIDLQQTLIGQLDFPFKEEAQRQQVNEKCHLCLLRLFGWPTGVDILGVRWCVWKEAPYADSPHQLLPPQKIWAVTWNVWTIQDIAGFTTETFIWFSWQFKIWAFSFVPVCHCHWTNVL